MNLYKKDIQNRLLAFLLLIGVGGLLCIDPAVAQYPGFGDPGAATATTSGAGLVPVTPNVDGGEIPTGATAQVVVRFRNEGGQAVETGLIRLYPSSTVSATVSMNQCEEEPLLSGAECAIALSVKGLQSGPWRVEMLMSHSGRTRLVTTTVSGTVESSGDASDKLASDIEATPDTMDFGSLNSSQTLVQPITLRNITSQPIDITKVYIDTSQQAGYSLKTECESLDPGQACMVVASWSPKLPGRSSGVIVVNHTGPTAVTSIPLSGEYRPANVAEAAVFPQAVPGKGLLVSSQTEIDFGSDVQTASTITVSLVNAGDADVTLSSIRLSGSDSGLSLKQDGCTQGTVLEPVEACPLTIEWTPTRVGAIFDDLQVVHDGTRGVLVLPVRGSASTAVSQDQKAIVLSKPQTQSEPVSEPQNDEADNIPPPPPPSGASYSREISNPSSVLDGYKITSIAPTRAIISGPGGSRIVFDQEEVVIGGIPWFIAIQRNGIEFLHSGERVLLLFDRSLSTINRVSSSGSGSSGDGG